MKGSRSTLHRKHHAIPMCLVALYQCCKKYKQKEEEKREKKEAEQKYEEIFCLFAFYTSSLEARIRAKYTREFLEDEQKLRGIYIGEFQS